MSAPRVSVLMAARNAAGKVRRSVESILNQEFGDLELIVVDDGSTDGTAAEIAAVADARLRLIRRDHHGLTAALNHAFEQAQGELLARQDAGDASRPGRIARQVDAIDSDPQLGLVGTWAVMCLPDGRPFLTERRPTRCAEIRRQLLVENCLFGATALFRRSALRGGPPYRPEFRYAQDYDLHLRLAESGAVCSLPEVLYECEAPLDGGISFARIGEQDAYARLAVELADLRRRGLPEPGTDELARLIRRRLLAIRPRDRALLRIRSLDRWARKLWECGWRAASTRLFVQEILATLPCPTTWPAAGRSIGGFAGTLAARKLRRRSPRRAPAPP